MPVKAWTFLGDESTDFLWVLMVKIFDQEIVPGKWRGSIIVPIYKVKGYILRTTYVIEELSIFGKQW